MADCKHDFDCVVGVAMFEDKPGQGSVEVTGACRHCGVPLVFYGQSTRMFAMAREETRGR